MSVMQRSRSRSLVGTPGGLDPWVARVQDEQWREGAAIRFVRRHNSVLLLVSAGQGTLITGGRAWPLAPGCLFALVPGIPHRVESALSQPLATVRLVLAGRDPEDWIRRHCGDPAAPWPAGPEALEAVRRIAAEAAAAARGDGEATAAAAHWLALLAVAMRRHASRAADGPAQRAYALLQRDPRRPPSLATLARACGVRAEHLCRSFAACYGEPPARCAQRLRRGEAEDLLADPTRSLTTIALALGFSDASAFGKAFRRWTGLAPAAWRRRHQA